MPTRCAGSSTSASTCRSARASARCKGRMFRIGHLGDSNDLTLLAALAGCEMGLKLSGVKLAGSGVQAAMDYFASHAAPRCRESGLVARASHDGHQSLARDPDRDGAAVLHVLHDLSGSRQRQHRGRGLRQGIRLSAARRSAWCSRRLPIPIWSSRSSAAGSAIASARGAP